MTKMGENHLFQRNSDYVLRELVGEFILVPTGKAAEDFFGIVSANKTGAFLWKALEEKRSLAELSRLLAGEYELEEEESLRDVSDFLELALSRGLVLRC